MSYPANRLASFRSYSYFHVLAVCDSTATADALAQSTDENIWLHADDTGTLGKYSTKQLGFGGKYCVLINGSTDSAFVIDSAHWTSATAASATQSDRSTSVAVEGQLSVSEPKGVVFLDQVVKCCGALGVDASVAVFVLKTFFVGHGYEPTVGEFVEVISDVAPLQFIAYDVTGSFTELGGSYDIAFVSCTNGASRLPQYSKAAAGLNFPAQATLRDTVKKLQEVINTNYKAYYACVTEQVQAAAVAAQVDSTKITSSLRPVQYVIEVGGDYEANPTLYTVTNQPEQAKNYAGCDQPGNITIPANTSVEDAIHRIMQMCPKVLKDMSEGDSSDGKKYEYKIHTTVQSTPSGGSSSTMQYTVYYRIERFMRPKDIAMSFDPYSDTTNNPLNDPVLSRNIIQFDYIYTGKNVDILEFDMKINMGIAYLQIATLANTFKSQLEPSPMKMVIPSTAGQTMATRFGEPVQIPIFFGTQLRTPMLRNTQTGTDTAQAAYTMAQHSALEVSDVSMKIFGNVDLLGTVNSTSSPSRLVNGTATSDGTSSTQNANADFADWGFVPAYAKVKVKMPRNNDDMSLLANQTNDTTSSDYAEDFWFDGYYYVYSIEHSFEGGEFTQTMRMLGIPPKGIAALDQTSTNTKELDFTQRVSNCFDNVVPAISEGTKGSYVAEPVNGDTSPAVTNRADAETLNSQASEPSHVEGWNSASSEVQNAIMQAARAKGVDPALLAQMAAVESSMGKNTVNSASSARGLFQFVSGTWMELVHRGAIPGIASNATDATAVPLSSVHSYNAMGGAQYVLDNQRAVARAMGWANTTDVSAGDTYLAHFLGAGGAIAVIKGDTSSSGMTMLQAYQSYFGAVRGAKLFAIAKSSNPPVIKSNATTVREVRTWAATRMASTLSGSPSSTKKTSTPARTASQTVAVAQPVSTEKPASAQKPCNQTPPAATPSSATTQTKSSIYGSSPARNTK